MQTNQPTSKELAIEPPGTLGLGQSCVRPPKTLEGQENRTCFDCCTKRPPHVVLLTSRLPAKPPGKPRRPFRGFMAEKGQKAPKRTVITSLGSPGLSSHSFSGLSGRKGPKKPENGLGRQAWEAQACHRNPFRGFLAKKHQEIPTQTGMTSLGNPGSSSQSISRFSGRKKPKNTRTDWDNKPGKPRLVIPVRFGVFRPKKGQQKPETDWDHKPEKAVS